MYNVPHTEAEAMQLLALRNEFWLAFGKLVAQTLAKMPQEFHDDQLLMIEDLCSAHGSNYDEHLRDIYCLIMLYRGWRIKPQNFTKENDDGH